MISFDVDDTTVTITVKAPYPLDGTTFVFRWNAATVWAAKLLEHALEQAMHRALEQARREAYAQGWKDAKAKKGAKETWFSPMWPS